MKMKLFVFNSFHIIWLISSGLLMGVLPGVHRQDPVTICLIPQGAPTRPDMAPF